MLPTRGEGEICIFRCQRRARAALSVQRLVLPDCIVMFSCVRFFRPIDILLRIHRDAWCPSSSYLFARTARGFAQATAQDNAQENARFIQSLGIYQLISRDMLSRQADWLNLQARPASLQRD